MIHIFQNAHKNALRTWFGGFEPHHASIVLHKSINLIYEHAVEVVVLSSRLKPFVGISKLNADYSYYY